MNLHQPRIEHRRQLQKGAPYVWDAGLFDPRGTDDRPGNAPEPFLTANEEAIAATSIEVLSNVGPDDPERMSQGGPGGSGEKSQEDVDTDDRQIAAREHELNDSANSGNTLFIIRTLP